MTALGRRLQARARLALEVLLALALLLLDARDLWLKLRWIGPRDAFAFSSTQTLALQPTELRPASNRSAWPGQAVRQASGWPSFLDKCASIAPLRDSRRPQADVDHVLGRNCRLGPASNPTLAPELVLASSLRVDTVAWAACDLLYLHRKPPICHSAIVKHFRERYALLPSLPLDRKWDENATEQHYERAEPGSNAEMELLELLNVVSKSAPLSDVVCVEGFVNKGDRRYEPEIFGCASPNYFRSAFVGHLATSFRRLQQDKAWLTSDVLHVMEMTLLVRSNARGEFHVRSAEGPGSELVVEHRLQLNVSCFGALYSLLVLVDLLLMALNVCSTVEVVRWMLWPVWKSALRSQFWAKSGSYVTKLGFTTDDYSDVLRASLLRSRPVALLAALSRLLTWAAILPLAPVALIGSSSDAVTRANVLLTVARLWLLVLLAVNASWDALVALDERRALRLARGTFVSKLEVASVTLVVGYSVLSGSALRLLQAKRLAEHQRSVDSTTFRSVSLAANAFPEQQDSLQNTPIEVVAAVFGPLVSAVTLSVVAVALVAVTRWSYLRARSQDEVERHLNSLMTSSRSLSVVSPDGSDSPSKPSAVSGSPSKLSATGAIDTTNTTAGILMNSSPTKLASLAAAAAPPPLLRHASFSFESVDVGERLPLEALTDVPMRARSLVRDTLFMETNTGQQVTLRPSLYLEFGVVLLGNALRTRCGFLDVVQTQLHAQDHTLRTEVEPSSSSSPLPSTDKPSRDIRELLPPLG